METARNHAVYLSDLVNPQLRKSSRTLPENAKAVVAAIIAFVLVFGASASAMASYFTVHAAEEVEEEIDDAIGDYGEGGDFDDAMDQYETDRSEDNLGSDNPMFGDVIARVFSLNYLNATPEGTPGGGYDEPEYTGPGGEENALNCSTEAAGAGTPYYHNCDVPNIVTEFVQDFISLFVSDGFSSAGSNMVTMDSQWFGLPSTLPDDEVPVDPAERTNNHTALELYGYSMNYTMYHGEWDHLKVFTSARALSNFGFMDHIRLGFNTIVDGVMGGISEGADRAMDSLSDGDFFGAIGGAFTGFWDGATGGSLTSIIDTSDLNVFNTYSWYRVGYGNTLYNARQLSESEVAQNASSVLYEAILGTEVDDEVAVPSDLRSLETGPRPPQEEVRLCEINIPGVSAEWSQWTNQDDVNVPPGPSRDECEEAAEEAVEDEDGEEAAFQHSDDTDEYVREGETIAEWEEDNEDWFEQAEEYGMTFDIDSDGEIEDVMPSFEAQLEEQYETAANEHRSEVEEEALEEWLGEEITEELIAEELEGNPEANFNAPWNRYVCTDDEGEDLEDDSGNQVYLLDHNGNVNDACSDVRAPIQNGWFGNGYLDDTDAPAQDPPVDTRNERLDTSIMSIFFPIDSMMNGIANMGLGSATFLTRISNTILNLSFSPVLDTLGIDEIIVDLIEEFRDSVFFSLAMFGAAITGFIVIVRAGKQQIGQFKTILIMVLTFVTGAILLFRPAETVSFVDEGPAMVETAIAGSLFNYDDTDQVCTASGASGAGGPEEGLDGDALDYSPEDATRQMLCENWRIFAFNPWVHGQWGVGYGELENSDFSNDNEDLVGDAEVNMGGGVTENNWALYQMELMSSGTTTHRDYTDTPGHVDPDMYRIVDLQAGPNNGEGTDPRHFDMWSGSDMFDRMSVGLLAPINATAGLVVVVMYSLAKIQITFLTTLMMLALPFVLALGMVTGFGMNKLRGYVGTIIGLMVQRVFIVAILAIMLSVLFGVAESGTSYFIMTIGTLIICFGFMMIRKTLLSMILKTTSSSFGEFGSNFAQNPGSAVKDYMPRSMSQMGARGTSMAKGVVAGAAGGFVAGSIGTGYDENGNRKRSNPLQGMREGASDAVRLNRQRTYNRQRREGFGGGIAGKQGYSAGKRQAEREYTSKIAQGSDTQDADRVDVGEDISKALQEDLEKNDPSNHDANINIGSSRVGANNKTPKARHMRQVGKITKTREKLRREQANRDTSIRGRRRDRELTKSPDIDEIKSRQHEVRSKKARKDEKNASLKERYDNMVKDAAQSESREIQNRRNREKQKENLKDLWNRLS